MATNKDKSYPIPEVLTGDEWEITVGIPAKVVAKGHKMAVPLSPDPHDAVIRTHEMAHIKWSPHEASAIPKDVNQVVLGVVEDMRINSHATYIAKADLSAGYDPAVVKARIEGLIRTGDEEMLTLALIGYMGTGSYPLAWGLANGTKGALGEDYRKVVAEVEKWSTSVFAKKDYVNFEHSVNLTRIIESRFKQVRDAREAEAEKKAAEEAGKQMSLRRPGVQTKAMEDFEKQLKEQNKGMKQALGEQAWTFMGSRTRGGMRDFNYEPDGIPKPFSRLDGDDWVPWGEMEIQEPPLVNKLPGRMGRKTRPSDMGVALCYPQRLFTDAKVFGRRLPSLGGAVLIDGSGSMSLTHEQVFKILKAAPGCTVAIYGAEDDQEGTLRILAKKGLYCDPNWVRSPGGHNVVDLPALMWLAKQEEPRIWVSDGLVTARGEAITTANILEVGIFVVRNRILRLPHAEEAIQHLEKIQQRRLGILAA